MNAVRWILAGCLTWGLLGAGCEPSDEDDPDQSGGSSGHVGGAGRASSGNSGLAGSPATAGGAGGSPDSTAGASGALDAGEAGTAGANAAQGGASGEGGHSNATSGNHSGGSPDAGAGGSDQTVGGAAGVSCADQETLEILTAHVLDLETTAGLLAGHASEFEATSFLLAPGMSGSPALGAAFASLFQPCTDPVEFDEYCDGELCSVLACTGQGAGWRSTTRLEAPVQMGDFSFESVEVGTLWSDGSSGITFTINVSASGANASNWSLVGEGSMDAESLEVEETFEALLPGGPTLLEAQSTSDTLSGTVSFAGAEIARFDDEERLVPSGDCL